MDQKNPTHTALASEMLAQAEARGWQVPAFHLSLYRENTTKYCVVIPVINEGRRIHSLLTRMHQLGIPEVADIILVDGGSSDGSLTPEALASYRLAALITKTGPGKLSSQLRCGYAFALLRNYSGIITIDGNDKDDPASIPAFIEALDRGIDFAQASRFIEGGVGENTPLLRLFAIRFVHAPMLSFASGFRWTDTTQGFRAYSAKMLLDPKIGVFRDVFRDYELLAYLSYRVPKLRYRCAELPTSRIYPANEATPTKIKGLSGNFKLLRTLWETCQGAFNPE